MADQIKSCQELHGWKEIAQYLEVSVRKAQTLEKQHALPVRRSFGSKGPVFAKSTELDIWKDQYWRNAAAGNAEAAEPDQLLGTAPIAATPEATALVGKPSRRKWVLAGFAAVAVGGLGFGLNRVRLHRGAVAVAARVDRSTLIALGSDGQELWRHTFAEPLNAYPPGPLVPPKCLIADLDGDGRSGLLFAQYTGDPAVGRVLRFDPGGKIRWSFTAGRQVSDAHGNRYLPPYSITTMVVVPPIKAEPGMIIVSSIHHWSYPTQVAVLDARTGKLLGEYWHRGHLRHSVVANLDGSDTPNVIIGGVNDAPEYKRATLVAFSPKRVAGASRDPDGRGYYQEMTAGSERTIIFFPRTEMSKNAEFNVVAKLQATGTRIVVAVAEGASEDDPTVIYEFDYSFRPTNIALSGALIGRLIELQEQGKLRQESPYDITKRLMAGLKIIRNTDLAG